MKNPTEIILKYTAGEATLEETNAALKEAGSGLYLDPQKNILTEEDKRATTIGYYPDQANGWGLLDTGTGSLDKVQVVNGKTKYPINTVIDGEANMLAYVLIAGRTYKVMGDTLVDC